jgi:hypothetical protein
VVGKPAATGLYGTECHGSGRISSPVLRGFWVEAGWHFAESPPSTVACLRGILG